MMSDPEIDRSAMLLIRYYGEFAGLKAAIRADQLLDEGDMKGVAVWRRIIRAIERLQAQLPRTGQTVH